MNRSMSFTMGHILVISLFLVVGFSSVADQCPTWFKKTDTGSCECGPNLGAVVKCDNCSEEVSIAVGYCMTYDNTSGQLVIGFTNNDYLGGGDGAYVTLPRNISHLNDFMCKNRREGFLCGKCADGYGPAINSLQVECVECKELYAVGIYLLLVILPITVFFILVVVFSFNFPSSPLLGYIMFCQYISTATRSNIGIYISLRNTTSIFGQRILDVSLSLAQGWWYFISVFYFIPPVCLSQKITNLQLVCLEYILVVYPLLLTFLIWLCIELHARDVRLVVYLWKPIRKWFFKVRRNWSVSDSIIHAYATILFLSFSNLTFASLNLLFVTDVYTVNGTVSSTVLVYDPTVEWFSPHHLPYAIPAIILLFFLGFCPTALLLLYSIKSFKKYLNFGPRMELKLNIFAETFQACYKDGLNGTFDFRFLSSAPMILILSMVPLGILNVRHNLEWHVYTMYSFSILASFVSIFIAYSRPYKSLYLNISVSFHILEVGLLTMMTVIWFDDHTMTRHSLAVTYTILFSLPHLITMATLLCHILKRIHFVRRLFQIIFDKVFQRRAEVQNMADLLPGRVQNSHAYQPLGYT